MRLTPGIATHVDAIRDAFGAAGQVRLLGAISAEFASRALSRAQHALFVPRVSELGLVWVGGIDELDELAAEVAGLWSAVVGSALVAEVELLRFRKGSWSEPFGSECTRWFIELSEPINGRGERQVDTEEGGFLAVDGVPRASASGALDVVGPGLSVEVPLLVKHADRLWISGALR